MNGNRKHGFMRASRAGRNGARMPRPWFCDGCQKEHGRTVIKTGYKGGIYCDRKYLKLKSLEVAECKQREF